MVEDILGPLARAHPTKAAVICDDVTLTYRELFVMKERIKRYLIRDIGIRCGDKIAFYLPNCAEFIYSFFAVAEIGAVTIPLNTHFKELELLHYVDRCRVNAIITLSNLISNWGALPVQKNAPPLIFLDRLELPSIDSGTEPFHKPVTSGMFDTEILYLCTSGSSGRPKIIPKKSELLFAGAQNLGAALAVNSDDRFLCVTPLFHANGFENSMFLPIIKGGSIVLLKEFSARGVLDILSREDITVMIGSPFIFRSLCDIADRSYNLSGIRHCLSAGAPLPIELKHKFYETFGVRVREHYGASETGPISVQFADIDQLGAVGKPLQNVRIKILDESGMQLPPGLPGEVFVSSNSMVNGYLDEPDLSREAFQKDYFRTGDLGVLDQDGNLYIVGRKKAIINASGIKIDPTEIRNVLLLHPKIKDAYVTGVKNKKGMEVIKAIVVARPECTVGDVITFCRDRLADFKIPRVIEFRENIPVDAMGKIVRSAVGE